MPNINLIEREMSTAELARMVSGFDEHTQDKGVEIQDSVRIGFVAMDAASFVGCISGLAYKTGDGYSGWFYLTDLYVEKAYRFQGIGSTLLKALEQKILKLGIDKIWTWTAGYEGPGFYKKHHYRVFTEMENWYSAGQSRMGLRKDLEA